MLNRLRGKKNVKGAGLADEKDDDTKKQGFLCPICMATFPGPSELQIHFEKIHSRDGAEDNEKLLNLDDDDDNEDTDAFPGSNMNDGFGNSHLEVQLNEKVVDFEKEAYLLRQEIVELKSELKEEKWYSGQLKTELDKLTLEFDKLEEDKKFIEEEYQNQLKSAEIGYLKVVEENKQLKEEVKFADYHTTKERHENLKSQLLSVQKEVEEERQQRIAIEDKLNILKTENQNKSEKQFKKKASQTTDEIIGSNQKTQFEIQNLNETIRLKTSDNNELMQKIKEGEAKIESLCNQLSSLEQFKKEVELSSFSKDAQIASLQTAINTSSEALSIVHNQVNERQTEITNLEQKVSQLERSLEERSELVVAKELVIKETQLQLAAEKTEITNLEKDLINAKSLADELQQKNVDLIDSLKELESKLIYEKGQVARLEREQVELIAKIEAGDGANTVIQQLSQEKILLLESISSLEKTLEDQTKLHKKQMNELLHEKNILQADVQKCEYEIKRTEALLLDLKDKEQNHLDIAASLDAQLKLKSDICQQQLCEMEVIKDQLDKMTSNQVHLQEQLNQSNELAKKFKEETEQLEQVESELLKKVTALGVELEKINFEKSGQIKDLQNQLLLKDENFLQMSNEKEILMKKFDAVVDQKDQEISVKREELNKEKLNLEEEIKRRMSSDNKLEDLQLKYKKLESYMELKDETLNSLQAKLEVAERDLLKPCVSCQNYEVQLCRLQENLKDENSRLNLLSQQITALQTQVQEKSVMNTELKLKIEEITTQSLEKQSLLEQKILSAIEEKGLLNEQLMKTEEMLKKESQLREALDETLEKESLIKENLRNENDKLKASIDEKDEKLKEAMVNIQHNEVRLDDLNSMLILKENDITKIWNEKQLLEKELLVKENNLLVVREEGKVALEREKNYLKESKDEALKTQLLMQEEIKSWIEKVKQANEDSEQALKLRDLREVQLNKEIAIAKENLVKIEQESEQKEKKIHDLESKVKSLEKKANDLKGDVTVLEARVENSGEEKKALLDRILSTEEKYKKSKQNLSETNKKLELALSGLQELGQENQNLQVRQVMLSNRQWADDNFVTNCKKCNKTFNLTTRKHHCRNCGLIFCSTCSQYSAVIASNKNPVRVCETCSVELGDIRGTNVRRISNSSLNSSQSFR